VARGWNRQDPKKGVPYRHTRAKIELLLLGATAHDLFTVIGKVADKRPDDVLDAVIAVMDDEARSA
jgi:hypothetical protein